MMLPKIFTLYVGSNLCEAEVKSNGNYTITYLNSHQNALDGYEEPRSNVIYYLLSGYWIIKSVISE